MSLRIIDANLNRAREGLRTAEEYARLVLNDAESQQMLKDIRRYLEVLSRGLGPFLLAARDIVNDIGTRPDADDVKRKDPKEVAIAGLKRTQEALRVIEEYGHGLVSGEPIAPVAAKARYSAYAVEQRLFLTAPRLHILRTSPVMAIFSNASLREDWREVLASLLGAGCRLFQLREKTGGARTFAAFGRAFLDMAGDALTIINDRPDVA
jgi:thiamine-phosphate pyrophosphorylase